MPNLIAIELGQSTFLVVTIDGTLRRRAIFDRSGRLVDIDSTMGTARTLSLS